MIEKELQYSDQTHNKATLYNVQSKNTIVILPALGVRASFYKHFAKTLSTKNYNVVTVDWRGHGASSVRASRTTNFGYKELINDVKELLNAIDIWLPNTQRIVIGHSLGGQIASLFSAQYPDKVAHLILITSCSVYYKGWSALSALKVYSAAKLFYPISKIVGYFPGNIIGFGGKEAKNVMKDWCNNALTNNYKLSNTSFNYDKNLATLTKKILSISIKNDVLASKKAVKNLYTKFHTQSDITHLHLSEEDSNIKKLNHFNWAKHPEYFTQVIHQWLQKRL